jgi:transposase
LAQRPDQFDGSTWLLLLNYDSMSRSLPTQAFFSDSFRSKGSRATAAFKEQAVKGAEKVGSLARTAEEWGLVEQTLGHWVKAVKAGELDGPGPSGSPRSGWRLAKRASAAIRLGGTWVPGSMMPRPPTVSMRCKASTSAGALTLRVRHVAHGPLPQTRLHARTHPVDDALRHRDAGHGGRIRQERADKTRRRPLQHIAQAVAVPPLGAIHARASSTRGKSRASSSVD